MSQMLLPKKDNAKVGARMTVTDFKPSAQGDRHFFTAGGLSKLGRMEFMGARAGYPNKAT